MATIVCQVASAGATSDWPLVAGASKVIAVIPPDDDATSYLRSTSTNNTVQQFNLSPTLNTGDTITEITLTARMGRNTQNTDFVMGYSFTKDGGGTQSGTSSGDTATNTWTNFTYTHSGLSAVWGSGLVIYVQNTQAREARISTFYATITYTPVSGGGSATIDVTSGNDDAGQVTAGTMYLTSTSLNVNSSGDEYAIMVFRDLPIPAGATIKYAYLNVYTTSAAYDDPNLTIAAQDSVAPANPSSTAYDISSRSRMGTTVAWNAANIGINFYYQSPDISAIIQAFIALSGYTQNTSDIAIIMLSAGSGALRWQSKDAGSNPPQLYLNWVLSTTTYPQTVAGTLTTAGVSVKRTGKPAMGTLTTAGATIKKTLKAVAGALTSTGALAAARLRLLALAGTLASTGALTKRGGKAAAGALTSAGAIARSTRKAAAGTLAASGAVVRARRYFRAVAGTLSSAGAVVKRTAKTAAGSLGLAGNPARGARKALAGTLNTAGALNALRAFTKAISGALGMTGAVGKLPRKALAGTLAPVGVVVKRATRTLAGTLALAGTVVKRTGKSFGGTLTSAGGIATQFGKVLASTLSMAGGLVKRTGKPLAGAITPNGAVVKRAAKALAGALIPVGAVVKGTLKTLAGALALAGDVLVTAIPGGVVAGIVALTAQARSFALTAKERAFSLTVKDKD